MRYNEHPPYEILQNKLIDFALMQRMRRFAKYWDLVGNSGNFVETTPLIWNVPPTSCRQTDQENSIADGTSAGGTPAARSPFVEFLRWSDWLYTQIGRTDSIALVRLAEMLFQHLTTERSMDPKLVAETLWRDWQRGGRHDRPEFLRAWLTDADARPTSSRTASTLKRQSRHGAVS